MNRYPHTRASLDGWLISATTALVLVGLVACIALQDARLADAADTARRDSIEARRLLTATSALTAASADRLKAAEEDAAENAAAASDATKRLAAEKSAHAKHHRSAPRAASRPNRRSVVSAPTWGWRTARASWYGSAFYGNTMAGGGTYGPKVMGVAHKTLPFGTRVQIQYRGKTITVPVVDRGPYVAGREFDLTYAAAQALDLSGAPTVRWRIQ